MLLLYPRYRMMLDRINTLSLEGLDFAFETTLAARTFARFLRNCKDKGYRVNLIYVWLDSPDLAVLRVAKRVASGGHNIPQDIIRRRYQRSLYNLTELYLPLADRFQIYDNSKSQNSLVAYRLDSSSPITVIQQDIWNLVVNSHIGIIMSQIDFSAENISQIFQEAVDEAIEQHRLNGQAIAVSDEQGLAIEIQPENITPLAQKRKQTMPSPPHIKAN